MHGVIVNDVERCPGDTASCIVWAVRPLIYPRNAKSYHIPSDHQVATSECGSCSYCKVIFGNLHFTCFPPETAIRVFMNTNLTPGFLNSFGRVLSQQLLPTVVDMVGGHRGIPASVEGACKEQKPGLLGLTLEVTTGSMDHGEAVKKDCWGWGVCLVRPLPPWGALGANLKM